MTTDKSSVSHTQTNTAKSDSGEPNPLEMPPYNVSRDSKEYKSWRQAQYKHGVRNLLLALLVFGGLALIYWLTLSN